MYFGKLAGTKLKMLNFDRSVENGHINKLRKDLNA